MSRSKFLSLPIEIRNNIYEKVLAVSQPLHIFQDRGCPVESFIPGKPYAWLALLYTNRQISQEAGGALYRSNKFSFQESDKMQPSGSPLESFIKVIGSSSAGSLSHICINFPATGRTQDEDGEINLREDSLRRLRLLQQQCVNLTTLEVLIMSDKTGRLLIEEDNTLNREVLSEINAQLRGIISIRKIIVRVYSGRPAPSVREFLQALGWIILMGDRN